MAVYPSNDAGDVFVEAERAFSALVGEMGSDGAMAMTHDEVERLIDDRGTEVLRQLFQGHLDLRAVREPRAPVVGADGLLRNHRRNTARQLETLFGEVDVPRQAWSTRGSSALHPLDAQLNLPENSYSFGLQRRVCDVALGSSFDRTVDLVVATSGGSVAKRQAEQIVVQASVDFDAFYEATTPEAEDVDDLLVLSFDGKGVVMRFDALRPATRKAALLHEPKLQTRLSKGEKPNRKRMAVVATVYSLTPVSRTVDEILSREKGKVSGRPRPKPYNKRVWASLVQEPETVIDQAFQEALARDPDRRRRWVVLVDGNATQIRLVRKLARRYRVEVTLVLDVVHVIEYLWKAAWCFHAEGDPAAETWVKERLAKILAGRSSHVAAGIRRSATWKLSNEDRAAVDTAANYLISHARMLRYDQFLRDGLPIATGVIEGACRHLVADRMDITGARWGLRGAEAVLRIRALHASGDLDAYWHFHTRSEFERVHRGNYADPTIVDHQLRQAA